MTEEELRKYFPEYYKIRDKIIELRNVAIQFDRTIKDLSKIIPARNTITEAFHMRDHITNQIDTYQRMSTTTFFNEFNQHLREK